MKKIFGILAAVGLLLGIAADLQAKSYVSASYKNKYERLGVRKTRAMLRRLDKMEQGDTVTLDEFKNIKLSRWEEKERRQEMKKGTYKTPEQQFKAMDVNEDGVVDRAEMAAFYARQAYEDFPSRKDRDPDVAKEFAEEPEEDTAAAAEGWETNLMSDNTQENIKEVLEEQQETEKQEKNAAGAKTGENTGAQARQEDAERKADRIKDELEEAGGTGQNAAEKGESRVKNKAETAVSEDGAALNDEDKSVSEDEKEVLPAEESDVE